MPIYELNGRRPVLPASGRFYVAETGMVIGDVVLGEDVSVWFGAVLRGDTERLVVGARTNIQDQCILHADPGFPLELGEDCTLGHRAIVHGCTVGDGSLIGMGAIVLNGARIGRGSIVGAGALVTEGKEFADGMLIVGAPARAVRELTAEQQDRARATAEHYVANGRRFAEGLRRV
jgi:carbonic anhydrase/acetyltransferase-like protein (isoleucine patch superfamily)